MLWKIDLRVRVNHARQERRHGHAEMQRKVMCLIEPPLILAPRVERDRHHAVRPVEHSGAAFTHQRTQAWGDRSAAVVLERVDDVFHPPVVGIDRGGATEGLRRVEADLDARGVADAVPAHLADRAVERMGERGAARRARRLKEMR